MDTAWIVGILKGIKNPIQNKGKTMETIAEQISAIEVKRIEVRERMFLVEEAQVIRMIEKFTADIKFNTKIVSVQRKEREKMFDEMIEAIKSGQPPKELGTIEKIGL